MANLQVIMNSINQVVGGFVYYLISLLLLISIIMTFLLIRNRNTVREKNLNLKKIRINQNKIREHIKNLSARIEIRKKYNNHPIRKKADSSGEIINQDNEIKILSRELKQWKKRVSPLIDRHKKLTQENKKLKKELNEMQKIISTLEIMNSPNKSKTVIDINNYRSRDNLQEIRGIGPSIEKVLNNYDIFRFKQIADISEYQIEIIARDIKGLKSQIYREDWIGQAEYLINKDLSEIN